MRNPLSKQELEQNQQASAHQENDQQENNQIAAAKEIGAMPSVGILTKNEGENVIKQAITEGVALSQIKKNVIPLNQTRIQEESYMRNKWFVTIEPKTKSEDLLIPEYWRHVSTKLKQFDKIDVVSEDATWCASYIVVASDRLWAKVHMLEHHDLTKARKDMPATDNENHKVEWKGQMNKFCVIRKTDGATLKSGFETQLEGYQWLDGHLKSLAA